MRRQRYRRIGDGTFASVIRAFKRSEKFNAFAPATKRSYDYLLQLAEEHMGALRVGEVRPARTQEFLDHLAKHPTTANLTRTALRAVEKWAIVREHLPGTITLGTEARRGTGAHIPWTDAQVALAEQQARPHIARLVTLASNTGQRVSDLAKMRWSDIEVVSGQPGINVIQKKTGLDLWVPFTQELITSMAGWERRPGFILLKEDGHPWTSAQMSDAWFRERAKNPVLVDLEKAGLVLHGLRSTAVVRLLQAGATTAQIAFMVGMSDAMVSRYSRKSVQRENAIAALRQLNNASAKKRTQSEQS